MAPSFCKPAALAAAMLCAGPPAAAQSPTILGYIDAVTADTVRGWACLPAGGAPASVAFYAGSHLIGVFPTGESRPDTAATCGDGAASAGFSITLTPQIRMQFLNQPALRFVALAAGAPAVQLPPSSPAASDPYDLPGGLLTSLSASGVLSGLVYAAVTGSRLPTIDILSDGLPGAGGQQVASVLSQPPSSAGMAAQFSAALPAAFLSPMPDGFAPSLYASAAPPGAPAVPLGSPAILGATYVSFVSTLAQSGSVSGITNALFTRWINGRYFFQGLTGAVSLSSNDPSFSEALVSFGFTGDSQARCQARNDTSPQSIPPFTRLAGYILKNDDIGGDTVPVSLALPYGVGLGPGAGVCLLTWISAGYPNLTPAAAKYVTVDARLAVALTPRSAQGPVTLPEGLGGEFLFPPGSTASLSTLVAMRMKVTAALDLLGGSVSAGGLAGVPASSNETPPARGWVAGARFVVARSADCAGLGLSFGPGNPFYSLAVNRTPAAYPALATALPLLSVPLYGAGASVTEQGFAASFPAPGTFGQSASVVLQPGDCLIAMQHAGSTDGALDGTLDLENQATAYLRVLK